MAIEAGEEDRRAVGQDAGSSSIMILVERALLGKDPKGFAAAERHTRHANLRHNDTARSDGTCRRWCALTWHAARRGRACGCLRAIRVPEIAVRRVGARSWSLSRRLCSDLRSLETCCRKAGGASSAAARITHESTGARGAVGPLKLRRKRAAERTERLAGGWLFFLSLFCSKLWLQQKNFGRGRGSRGLPEEEQNAELLQQNTDHAEVEMHAPAGAPSNKRAHAEDGGDERRKKTKRSKRKRKREVI